MARDEAVRHPGPASESVDRDMPGPAHPANYWAADVQVLPPTAVIASPRSAEKC